MPLAVCVAVGAGIGEEEAGVGAGLVDASRETGAAIGLAVVATIAYNGMAAELPAAGGDPLLIRRVQESANHDAFLSAACLAFVAVFMMLLGKASMDSRQAMEHFETAHGSQVDAEKKSG